MKHKEMIASIAKRVIEIASEKRLELQWQNLALEA